MLLFYSSSVLHIDQKHKPLLNQANLHKAFMTAWTIKILFR